MNALGRAAARLAVALAVCGWAAAGAQDLPPLAPPVGAEAPPPIGAELPPAVGRAAPEPEPDPAIAIEAPAVVPTADEPPAPSFGVGRASVIELIRSANPMLWPMVLCSVVTLGFALERFIALRRNRVLPRDFVDRFLDRLTAGKLDRERAVELCRSNDSPVARIFGRIVQHWGEPTNVLHEIVASEGASEVLDLKRNVRVLNATATLAPLLGLLGTVIGLIEAFDALRGQAAPGVGKGEALAHGISLALMATAFGLVIAIVSVTAYYYLLGRVDALVRSLDQEAAKVIDLVAGDPYRVAPEPRRPVVPADLGRAEPRTLTP